MWNVLTLRRRWQMSKFLGRTSSFLMRTKSRTNEQLCIIMELSTYRSNRTICPKRAWRALKPYWQTYIWNRQLIVNAIVKSDSFISLCRKSWLIRFLVHLSSPKQLPSLHFLGVTWNVTVSNITYSSFIDVLYLKCFADVGFLKRCVISFMR